MSFSPYLPLSLIVITNQPELDTYFIARKANPFDYDNKPVVLRYKSAHFSQQEMVDDLDCQGFVEWLELPQ